MTRKHVVKSGDCLYSLACVAGVPCARIQSHPDNQALMRLRPNPSYLLPGDIVTIPDKETKVESVLSEVHHRFRKLAEWIEIRVEIRELNVPRKNEAYHVEINGKEFTGSTSETDKDGLVVCRLPADTDVATVVFSETQDRYELHLGHIDPPDTPEGVHGRLHNLGYYDEAIDSDYSGCSVDGVNRCIADLSDKDACSRIVVEEQDRKELERIYGS